MNLYIDITTGAVRLSAAGGTITSISLAVNDNIPVGIYLTNGEDIVTSTEFDPATQDIEFALFGYPLGRTALASSSSFSLDAGKNIAAGALFLATAELSTYFDECVPASNISWPFILSIALVAKDGTARRTLARLSALVGRDLNTNVPAGEGFDAGFDSGFQSP